MKEFKMDKDLVDLQNSLVEAISKEISNRIETLVEIGLGKKGHTFSDKDKMYEFVKENCSKEHSGDYEKYFVNKEPFLSIDNTPYFDFDSINRASVTYGDFKFL